MSIPEKLVAQLRARAGADSVSVGERVQSLWSGYGEIRRLHLGGAVPQSVILKHVHPPARTPHARGWDTDFSHQRKLRSYAVELAFYERFASACDARCRVPALILGEACDGDHWFVLEDLDAGGFAGRRQAVSDAELHACIDWLAHFHATFLGVRATGLWEVGTYWHLATRPDELAAMDDPRLRAAAPGLDARLASTPFLTLVHGDAKLANACFSRDGRRTAWVDFQYVGGGCGMKDLAYFMSSCLSSEECEARADGILDAYFVTLRRAMAERDDGVDLEALEASWRALYPFAWADFCRFLSGWAPAHPRRHAYTERMTQLALASLG